MNRLNLGKPHALVALAILALVHVLFFAPAGFLTTDEFLYAAMTESLVKSCTLFFDNGQGEFASRALDLLFLTPTSKGLTPQYPAGYAFLAAPFFMVGGIRGMMVLNTLAALGMIYMIYRLAELLFGNRPLALNAALILGLASFLADYAFAILPHAIAGLCIVSAAYFAAAAQADGPRSHVMPVFAGLVVGLGIHFRVDTIIVLPLLMVWLVASVRKPFNKVLWLLIGLVPGLIAASAINYYHFGSLSPITYGRDPNAGGGLTTFAAYKELLPFLILGLLAMTAFGFRRVRVFFSGWQGAAVCLIGLVTLLVIPFTGEVVQRVLKGLYVLLIDLQSYDFIKRFSGSPQVVDGKWLMFSGAVKKALFESLPYAGFLALPLAGIFRGQRRATMVLLGLLPSAWFAFFALNQWHGGQSTNMRYFTPMLPFIAILAACAWDELGARTGDRPPWKRRTKLLLTFTILAIAAIGLANYQLLAFAFLVGTGKWVFLISLALALGLLALPQAKRLVSLSRGLFIAGLLLAFLSAFLHDVRTSYARRSWYLANRIDCAQLEPKALVIARLPRLFYCHFMRQQGVLAIFVRTGASLGPDLIGAALARGRPVYTDADTAEHLKINGHLSGYRLEPVVESGNHLLRVRPIQ